MKNTFDYIIVGGGSMGSATAYQLSKRGHSVLLLEQFHFIHEQGAHTGQSRLIRKAYFEHPDYVPLLLRAYQNWETLETETKEKVYYETGILYFGEPNDTLLADTKSSATLFDIPLDYLNLAETKEKYPMFAGIPDDWESIFEPEAGFLLVEKCIRLFLQQAILFGATLKAQEKVLEWKENIGGVKVITEKGTYYASKIIFTAGAWTDTLIQDLGVPLKVTKQVLGWVHPENWAAYTLPHFPCWAISDTEKGLYYGMPILDTADTDGPLGLKLGCHLHGPQVNPDAVDRRITATDEATFRHCLEQYMPPSNGEVLAIKTCLYTNSPDEHFIIDHHPLHPNVLLACGFSGHGFKFASVIGEALADLAIDWKTDLPIDFLSLKRFGI